MAKLTLAPLTGGYISTANVNSNYALIEAALENTLSRDGTSPNQMTAQLDMNSQRIINLLDAVTASEPVTLRQLAAAEISTGVTIAGVGITSDTYTGDGATVTFNTQETPPTNSSVLVTIDGVTQTPGVDYTVSGNAVTFTSAPPNGGAILLRNMGWALPTDPDNVYPEVDYPQTWLEIDAAVVPSDTAYPQGYIERYGADADGSTDNSAYIEKAAFARVPIRFWTPAKTDARVTGSLTYDYVTARYYVVKDAYVDSNNIIGPASLTGDGASVRAILELGQYRDVGLGQQWFPRRVQDIYFNGKARQDNGVRLGGQDGAVEQYANMWHLDACFFDRCNIGIYKPEGSFGNTYTNCGGNANNYHYVAIGYTSSPISHVGNDTFVNGEYNDAKKAGFVLDGKQVVGTGQTVFQNTIIEDNPGFGIYIKDYNNAYNPIVLENVWFESNASESTVDISDVISGASSVTPRDLYLENVDYLTMKNMNLGGVDIEMKDSTIRATDVYLSDTFDLTVTDSGIGSTFIVDNAHIYAFGEDGTGHGNVLINSVARIDNQQNAVNRMWLGPARTNIITGPEAFNATVLESSTSQEGRDWLITTGGSDVSPGSYVDGCTFPKAPVYTLLASESYQGPAQTAVTTTTVGKWYVYTWEIKVTSGLANIDAIRWGSAYNHTRGDAEQMLTEGEWHTMCGISEHQSGASVGAIRPFITVGAGGNASVAIGATQFVEFDNQADAVAFYNARCFVNSEEGEALKLVKSEDETINTDSTLSVDEFINLLPMNTNELYRITGQLFVTSAATPDFKAAFNCSNAPQFMCINFNDAAGTSGTQVADATAVAFTIADTNPVCITIDGLVKSNASTGGTIDLEWAQNTSNAANTTVHAGSWVKVERAFNTS